jgi:glycosyltransferase involved in cell wall biosynthesis
MLEEEIELLELKGYSRKQVNLLMNACDVGLLTSVREGSPMVVKEMMCVNRQIVSTDVGDVKIVCNGISGCYVTGFDPGDIAEKITAALRHSRTEGRTKGRERIFQLGLDGRTIAEKVFQIYRQVASRG